MKLTAKDLSVGEAVTVLQRDYLGRTVKEAPGVVAEIRRTKVEIRHTLSGHERTETFSIPTGVGADGYRASTVFKTKAQMDDDRRRAQALEVLLRHGLRPGESTDRPRPGPLVMDTRTLERLATILAATEDGA